MAVTSRARQSIGGSGNPASSHIIICLALLSLIKERLEGNEALFESRKP